MAEPAVERGEAAEVGAPHVLLVDDDRRFLHAMMRQLQHRVGSVRGVVTSHQALEVLAEAPVDVVVCDLVLGKEDGIALLDRVRLMRPAVARVLVTGFGERLDARGAFPAAQAVVYKPCDASSLAALIEALPGAEGRAARRSAAGAGGP